MELYILAGGETQKTVNYINKMVSAVAKNTAEKGLRRIVWGGRLRL